MASVLERSSNMELLLSKSFTLPLLAIVSYLTYKYDPSGNSKKSDASNSATAADSKSKSQAEASQGHTATLSNSAGSPVFGGQAEGADDFDYTKIKINAVDPDFDWSATPPFKYRPFKKGEYKLTMGIQNIPMDEWLMMEDTYLNFTNIKTNYMNNPDKVDHICFLSDECVDSAIEFYEASTNFMLQRYPQYFKVVEKEDGIEYIHNLVRDEYIELHPADVSPRENLIKNMTRLIEEDFIILQRDPAKDKDEYIFKGGCFGFAAGFDPLTVFQTNMTTIHGNVPGYKTNLRSQMNKFFDKVKPGVFVRRNNWSLQVHNKLLVFDSNKGKEDEEIIAADPGSLDYKREVFFRSERQTLTKLHRSKAMVFGIRTYLTALNDIREEGLADELIGGITGMQEILGIYKNRPKWGDAAVEFLSGRTNGTEKPWIENFE
ncbi:hypothetical protein WICPIJ_004374 [Wickerhamomyces pijperi]|uniref:Uncharacterized protein n=1 Tax=Wickerhamomyces pijperi TaxID=599730 RepID=A0A9P8Q5N6_WICPI|nr:hypothetical protein WICPIJ_004374 [Wickerhamomyces pijperi]